MLSEEFQKAWPYEFGLVYSVTLAKDTLTTTLQVQNKDSKAFEFQVLLHSYLKIKVGSKHALFSPATIAIALLNESSFIGYLCDPHQELAIESLH